MATERKKKEEKIPFETRLARLQEIIEQLEKGNIPLEESILLYKEGVEHAGKCQTLIENAKHEIKIVQGTELKDFNIVE